MGKKRNQYTKEYKVEAVRLMVEEGRPVFELARELGTAQSLLHRWKKKSEEGKIDPFPGPSIATSQPDGGSSMSA